MVLAGLHEGKFVQGFPFHGGERRGAPVRAFTRIDTKRVGVRTFIYDPDCIVVLSSTIPRDQVVAGLREGAIAVINTTKPPEEVDLGVKPGKVGAVDADAISLKLFGPRPIAIVNTTMMGAFARTTGWIELDSITAACREYWSGIIGEINARCAEMGYEQTKVKEF